jgi:hypothetical protein
LGILLSEGTFGSCHMDFRPMIFILFSDISLLLAVISAP